MPVSTTHTFTAGTTAVAAQVNQNFTDVEDYTAAIPVGDLADGTSAQIIVCNSSGVPTYRTASGALTVSNTGVFSLATGSAGQMYVANGSGVPTLVTPSGDVSVSSSGVFTVAPQAIAGLTHSNVSLTSGVDTALLLDGEDFDPNSMHSLVSNTSRVVAPSAGVYLVTAQLAFDAHSLGYRRLSLRKNGVATGHFQWVTAVAAPSVTALTLPAQIKLAANDYLEIYGLQSSGGALLTTGGFMAVTRVGTG